MKKTCLLDNAIKFAFILNSNLCFGQIINNVIPKIIDYFDAESDDVDALPPNLQFRKFQGHFGNTEGIGCNILDPIIGVNN